MVNTPAAERGQGLRVAGEMLALALAYYAVGRFGLMFMRPSGQHPAVWLPTGVAAAALIARGRRLAVGVALGAFAQALRGLTQEGVPTHVAALSALLIALAACVHALCGATLVRRLVDASDVLDEPRELGRALVLAGPVAALAAAPIGGLAMYVGHALPWRAGVMRGLLWWCSGTLGVVLLLPALLLWLLPEPSARSRRFYVTVPLVLATALATILSVRVDRWEQSRVEVATKRRFDAVTVALERALEQFVRVVQSVADMHRSVGRADRAALSEFVRAELKRAPDASALGWAPWVPPADYPVDVVEPRAENEALMGTDLVTRDPWRAALLQATRTGQTVVVPDRSRRRDPALAVVAPVPAAPGAHGPPAGTPVAFALGVVALRSVVEAAARAGGHDGLDFALFDPEAPSAPAVATSGAIGPQYRAFAAGTTARLAGRDWPLRFYADPSFLATQRTWQAFLVLTAGILFAAWLEAWLLTLTARASKVELLVAQRTRQLEESSREIEQQRTELATALDAREVLLKELHHRVKNNLQVIASLFSLQARYLGDQRHRDLFEESRNRVFSIALAHERLYRSRDLARIDFSEYARQLVDHLQAAFGRGTIAVVTDIEDVTLPVDTAIPCGLMINELVTNAFKHAFTDGRSSTIRIALRTLAPARWLVAIEDDGVGLPAEIDLDNAASLGLDLVSILAAQIGAKIDVRRGGGTAFRVEFGAGRAEEREADRRADA